MVTKEHGQRQLGEAEIDAIVAEVEAEKAATEAAKKAQTKVTQFEFSDIVFFTYVCSFI